MVLVLCFFLCIFFFFSSRRRHTRFDCDWSSDVCSSDLFFPLTTLGGNAERFSDMVVGILVSLRGLGPHIYGLFPDGELQEYRSEERRVGKECRSRWSPYH